MQIFGAVHITKRMHAGTQTRFGAFVKSSFSALDALSPLTQNVSAASPEPAPAVVLASFSATGTSAASDGLRVVQGYAKAGEKLWNTRLSVGAGHDAVQNDMNLSASSVMNRSLPWIASLGPSKGVDVLNGFGEGGKRQEPKPLLPLDDEKPGTQGEEAKTRWRGNMYIRDGGILPYGLCGSDGDVREPKVDMEHITVLNHNVAFTMLAASVWGESDETGKPTEVKHLQVAVFYQRMGKVCSKMPRNPYIHCLLPEWSAFEFECRIGQGQWQRMWRRNDFQVSNALVAQDILHCNMTGGLVDLKDKFSVQMRVFSRSKSNPLDLQLLNESATMDFEVCYQHVERTWPLVICTEPMYGHKKTSGFWFNHPWQRNNSFSVLDEFVTYHIMQGAKVQVHDHDGSLNISMLRYRGNPAVAYRRGWNLPAINYPHLEALQATAYETHAETACMWEHRFRAKWMQILHSADNFAFASQEGVLISDIARKLDTTNLSVILIPTCSGASRKNPTQAPRNIIEKYALLSSKEGVAKQRSRFTPIGDPRAFDSCNVHWFTAPRASYIRDYASDYAVNVLGYYTVHLIAMSIRKGRDLDNHAGRNDSQWNWLGNMLKTR
eukprot:CAMPEP_0173405834 /NCGR_PEP_ID=MMETSP1356-20130122/62888_1 /TAXON_ID=77927 ORGANISM="Hemiselmis virescens, Strain PCC157" /NCGR_SAMPLE_ID=MMETSP1356 /ASSEMBLY_ACC=CAM_ASM_000847 /LENGTH=607 /DNA_ID=CAMNT_0014366695 /DNA_START=1 /DNA_END=1821 /DNA_ORIENTATION=-